MAFQEAGTRILHDLGILDSNVQSPHRNQTIEDGNLQQTSKDPKRNKDESTQRLIDDSNPATTNNAPQRQSDTFLKEVMVYIFGIITVLAIWLLITDIPHISKTLQIDNIYQLSWIPTCLGVGTFIGSYLIIPLLLKVYALFIIQFFASFAVGIAILQYNYLNFSSLLFAMGFLGIAFGVIERFSYLYIHRVLQSSKRKVLFFYAVLAFGLIFANIIIWNSTVLPLDNFSISETHFRAKHDAGLPAINLSVYNPEEAHMTTESYRPTKPSSAIGISENQDTKTAENAEKRKLAELKKEGLAVNATTDCFTNPNAENCTKMLTQTSASPTTVTTTPTTTTLITSTTTISVKKDSIFDESKSELMFQSSNDPLDPIPRNRNRINKLPAKNENLKPLKPTTTTSPVSKESSSTITFVAIFIVILFLIPFNLAAFACNHFWCKETLLNIAIAAKNFKQPSFITRITSITLWFLSDFLTYGLFSLSPFIYASLFDKKIEELSFYYGILIWGLVFFKRILLSIFSDFAVTKRCMQILLFSSFCCSIIYFVLTKSDLSFIVFIGVGITISSLSVLIALHQQTTMNLSPYTTSGRYMLWSSMGRIFGPLCMGKILSNDSIQMLANLVFIIVVLMLISFYYFTKNITTTARQHQLQDLKMDISSPQSNESPTGVAAASSSSVTSTIKTRSTQNGTKYSLIDADDTDSLSNCLISDSEEDELLSIRR